MGILTNFGRVGVRVEKHSATVGHTTGAAKEIGPNGFARLHGLESKISAHGLWNIVAVIAVLYTLLGNVLDLCASRQLLVRTGYCMWRLSIPILEPDLNGALGHVDFLSDSLTCGSSRGRILVELDL